MVAVKFGRAVNAGIVDEQIDRLVSQILDKIFDALILCGVELHDGDLVDRAQFLRLFRFPCGTDHVPALRGILLGHFESEAAICAGYYYCCHGKILSVGGVFSWPGQSPLAPAG